MKHITLGIFFSTYVSVLLWKIICISNSDEFPGICRFIFMDSFCSHVSFSTSTDTDMARYVTEDMICFLVEDVDPVYVAIKELFALLLLSDVKTDNESEKTM